MKQIRPNRRRVSVKKGLVLLSLVVILIFAGLTFQGLKKFSEWDDNYDIKSNTVLEIKIQKPFSVVKREAQVIEKTLVLDYPEEIDTPIEKYICEKFGPYDCKTALAVAKAESGLREDALNINTNGTIDYGIFQINTVHYKKAGCTLKEITHAEKNVDCAYQIWSDQGWNPWVAWKNNAYLSKME